MRHTLYVQTEAFLNLLTIVRFGNEDRVEMTEVDFEVLNAASDDWESIEQIFISVRFEFDSTNRDQDSTGVNVWRERNTGMALTEIAVAIDRMVKSGFLNARLESGAETNSALTDLAVPCWFKTTERGIAMLESAEIT